MPGAANFSYARARLQAQFAELLGPAAWEHLLRSRDYAHFVQQARDTTLLPWVASFSPQTDEHQIEAHLRDQFRQRVAAVATWTPRPWREATAWVARLPDLSAMEYLARGHPAYPWMTRDEVLRPLLEPRTVQARGGLARLVDSGRSGGRLHETWLSHWETLWPAMPATDRRLLQRLRDPLRATLRPPDPQTAADPGGLPAILHQAFRRHTARPVAAFAYLGLYWLEMIRLRGALLRRRLLPAGGA